MESREINNNIANANSDNEEEEDVFDVNGSEDSDYEFEVLSSPQIMSVEDEQIYKGWFREMNKLYEKVKQRQISEDQLKQWAVTVHSYDIGDNMIARAMMDATETGNAGLLSKLLDLYKVDVNNLNGICLVQFAGSSEVMEIILNKGGDVNAKTRGEAYSPIHLAAKRGNVMMMEYLLGKGVNPDLSTPTSRRTPLHIAATYGQLEVIKVLIRRGATVDTKDEANATPLLRSIKNKPSLEVAQFLLDSGADVNAKSPQRGTALYYAAKIGNLQLVELLLRRGAKVNSRTGQGRTPFYAACGSSCEVAKLLLSRGAKIHGLSLKNAIKNGKMDVVEWLLETTELSTPKPNDPHTLLHLACSFGRLEIAKMLIERGFGVNVGHAEGATPLLFVCQNNEECPEVVELLFQHGALLDDHEVKSNDLGFGDYVKAPYHQTLVESALAQGHGKILKMLLDRGAPLDLNEVDIGFCLNQSGLTKGMVELILDKAPQSGPICLQTAVDNGKVESVQFLLERGVPATGPLVYRLCAAFHMPLDIRIRIAKLLLQYGASLNAPGQGRHGPDTPLMAALNQRAYNLIWVLTTHGASLSMPNGGSVLDLCGDNSRARKALFHFWTPEHHLKHPKCVRDAIFCLLLVAQRQHWPLDGNIMKLIFSFIAYDWTSIETKNEREEEGEDNMPPSKVAKIE